ncbi:MAG: DUF3052 family protein [Chloroflexi bacterium]|nr:DUF3052 family protein [Chloroflexota bacterium]HEV8053730.1 DUF3052 family protein [Candidatus Limnocylindrales bacterium]
MERPYERPLIDKLGVKPGARVAVYGVNEPDFRRVLRERTSDVSDGCAADGTDVMFLAADSPGDLAALKALSAPLKRDGAVWVVSRKGRDATIRDVDVIEAARAADLVDNKVVSFSDTHTALRLVIPRALR